MTIKSNGGIFGRNPTFNNVTVDGTLTVYQIVEKTGAAGITLDGVTLKDGNVVLANGKGVDFSATSGTGTSELFDDYEEGTWTPTVTSSSGTITTVDNIDGYYTKIGRNVTLWASARTVDNGTGTGSLRFANVPFMPASSTLGTAGYIGVGYNTGSGQLLRARITGGNTLIDVSEYDFSYPTASGRTVTITVTYYVS